MTESAKKCVSETGLANGENEVSDESKTMTRLRLKIFPIYVLLLFACATIPVKTYDETVVQWKSYKDVAGWMNRHFSYDMTRLKEMLQKDPHLFSMRTPGETFELKSGVCFDAALFAKETLNCIDPSYNAKVVFILHPHSPNHFVCSFEKDGKLFIMDYGTPIRNMVGVHGPYNSLEEYKKFYERYHPKIKHVQSITYGFPKDWPIQLPPEHRCKP